MRVCRYLWLLVGLIFNSTVSADTYLASFVSATYDGRTIASSSQEDICLGFWGNTSSRTFTSAEHIPTAFLLRCWYVLPGGSTIRYDAAANYACPYGGSLLLTKPRTCNAPSCPDGQVRDETGKCQAPLNCAENEREWNGECRPECDAMQTVNAETGNCECSSMRKPLPSPSVSGPGSTPETTCYGGCSYKLGDMALNLGGKEWFSDLGAPTGQTCSPGQGESEKPLPETKEPPCAPGEGVGTSSSGKVLCVPEGTPNAPKPDVQKTVKKETYPDGSEKTTETTKTKDPSTGATDTKSTSTSTGGMAGPAGTTTTTETSTGDGKGTGKEPGQGDGDGDGDCEGDDCGGGEGFKGPEGDLYEKKDRTMRDALEDFSAAVSDSPVMVAAQNWFSIGGMPASCGGLSVTVPYLDTTISADTIFCGEYGVLIMQIAGAVVLAAAAYAGFRIAIL